MLPAKIQKLVTELRDATENGQVQWTYDDEASSANTHYKDHFAVTVSYQFDGVQEVGRFSIKLFDARNRKDYWFHTSQEDNDYDLVGRLYDSAQSSDLDLG